MRNALYYAAALLAAIPSTLAAGVIGTAYGFASGVTGGADATPAAPSSAEELAEWLSDDTARVILIDQEYDFTGTTATDAGCDKSTCSVSDGGQEYIGELSCGGSDMVAVSSITYDAAGTELLPVGSNKSIISSNGKGVLKGKGLALTEGASNIIIQGIEFTNINPEYVWGGDALELRGNDGVWVDHCKFSLIGRQFVVGHYNGNRATFSNNEFDGTTTTSATCNNNHYWTMMFIADGEQVTLDRNYWHDLSGRAPKLGQDGVSGTFHATNNLFSNMKGHAFDAYDGASALLEGNVFQAVSQPMTEHAATVDTIYNVADSSAASACSSVLGRACVENSVDSSSGDFPSMSSTSGLSAFADSEYLITPVAADEVEAYVTANAGPANLASYTGFDGTASSGSSSNSTSVSSSEPSASASQSSSKPVATKVADQSQEQAGSKSGSKSSCSQKKRRAFKA